MNKDKELGSSYSGIIYGVIVYWITIASSLIVIIGSIVAFDTQADLVSPSYWLSSLWQGETTAEIWAGLSVTPPVDHWYLNYLGTGDGLTSFGISVGIFSVTLGMIASGIILFMENRKFLGFLALVAASVTVFAILGLVPLPS